MKSPEEIFGPPVFIYSRRQAIEDGEQIDVSRVAAEAGIKFPVFLTRAVFHRYVEVPAGVTGQDEQGRLWDVVWMLRCAIHAGNGGALIHYQLQVRNNNRAPKLVTLKAQCGPKDFDDPQPAITIMLPEED
jgi:hypothetical protein